MLKANGFEQMVPRKPAVPRRPAKGVESKPVEVKPANAGKAEAKK